MEKKFNQPISDEVSGFVHAFEDAWQGDEPPAVASYLPPADSALHLDVLCELIRVDLERKSERGLDFALSNYLERYPWLREAKPQLSDIAYEDYRLRRQSGNEIPPQWYVDQYDVDVNRWPWVPDPDAGPCRPSLSCHSESFWRQLNAEAPELAARYAEIHDAMPVVGTEFDDEEQQWTYTIINQGFQRRGRAEFTQVFRPEGCTFWGADGLWGIDDMQVMWTNDLEADASGFHTQMMNSYTASGPVSFVATRCGDEPREYDWHCYEIGYEGRIYQTSTGWKYTIKGQEGVGDVEFWEDVPPRGMIASPLIIDSDSDTHCKLSGLRKEARAMGLTATAAG